MRAPLFSQVMLGAALLCAAGLASADSPPPPTGDKQAAVEWAEKANTRFESADYAGAVEAMTEAEKHYRAPTFARLRAQALEKLGRLIEAREVYREIAAWDLPLNATDQWIAAKNEAPGQITALDARIPKLVIASDTASPSPVSVDGQPLSPDMLGKPIPRDPGKHEVTAGEGPRAVKRVVDLREGTTERVTIASEGGSAPRVSLTPGLLSFGVGAAGLAAGAIFGGLAMSRRDEVTTGIDACAGACSASEKARLDGVLADSKTFAGVSTAGFILAGVGAAAGATLVVLSRQGEPPRLKLDVTTGSVSLSGSF